MKKLIHVGKIVRETKSGLQGSQLDGGLVTCTSAGGGTYHANGRKGLGNTKACTR